MPRALGTCAGATRRRESRDGVDSATFVAEPKVSDSAARVAQKIKNVYDVMTQCKEPSTFEAVGELASNIITWEPPPGEEGIDDKTRLELLRHMVMPPPERNVLELRAPSSSE